MQQLLRAEDWNAGEFLKECGRAEAAVASVNAAKAESGCGKGRRVEEGAVLLMKCDGPRWTGLAIWRQTGADVETKSRLYPHPTAPSTLTGRVGQAQTLISSPHLRHATIPSASSGDVVWACQETAELHGSWISIPWRQCSPSAATWIPCRSSDGRHQCLDESGSPRQSSSHLPLRGPDLLGAEDNGKSRTKPLVSIPLALIRISTTARGGIETPCRKAARETVNAVHASRRKSASVAL